MMKKNIRMDLKSIFIYFVLSVLMEPVTIKVAAKINWYRVHAMIFKFQIYFFF